MAESERQLLERLRKEQGPIPGFETESSPAQQRQQLEALRKEQGDITPSFVQQAATRAYGMIAEPLGKAAEFVDRYTYAPIRSAYQAYQRGEPVGEAYAEQFGEPTSKAPTTANLMENFGISGEQSLPFTKIENFGTPYAKFSKDTISPAEVAGGVAGFVYDPTNYIPFGAAKPAENLVKIAGKGIEAGGKGSEWGLKKFSRYAAGVAEPDFDYYKANRARLDAPNRVREPLTGIRGEMLGDVEQLTGARDQLIKSQAQVESDLKNLGENIKSDLDTRQVIGARESETVKEALEKDKIFQGEQSKLADEALSDVNITAPRKTVERAIEAEIRKYTPNTKEKANVINYLQDLKNRLSENYDKYMSGPQLREWMRDVRQSIDAFRTNRNAGEYVGDLDKSLMDIQKFVSDSLKDTVPKYKEIMGKMYERNLNSQLIVPKFTGIDDKQGMQTLRRLLSKDPQDAAMVREQLHNWAVNNEHPEVIDLLNRIDRLKYTKEQLENYNYDLGKMVEIGGQNTNIPMFKKIQEIAKVKSEIDADLEMLVNEIGQFSSINRGQARNLIKNIGGLNPDPNYVEQLEAFEKATGKPYAQRIKDEAFEQRLEKDRASQSSRMTNLGMGTFGGVVGTITRGDPVATGLAITLGGLTGAAMDKFGGHTARWLWQKSLPATEAIQRLGQKMQNPSPKFQKYYDKIQKVSGRGGQGMLLYHHLLWNNDPEYREAIME